MSIWKTLGVQQQPCLTLVRWRIVEITSDLPLIKGQRHIIGYCVENHEGRCSTAIIDVDRENKICRTRSGRIYKLDGPPGFDRDGQYVWQTWTRDQVETIDVTDEVMPTA